MCYVVGWWWVGTRHRKIPKQYQKVSWWLKFFSGGVHFLLALRGMRGVGWGPGGRTQLKNKTGGTEK